MNCIVDAFEESVSMPFLTYILSIRKSAGSHELQNGRRSWTPASMRKQLSLVMLMGFELELC